TSRACCASRPACRTWSRARSPTRCWRPARATRCIRCPRHDARLAAASPFATTTDPRRTGRQETLMPAISPTAALAAPREPDVSRLEHDSLIRKVAWRLMPLVMVCYLFAFFDRINISFAKFQLQGALGLSDTAYGLGATLFVVGYVIFEVPSNLLLY